MTPIVKAAIALISVFVSIFNDSKDGREAKIEIGRTLDFLFCVAFFWFVAAKFGLFSTSYLESSKGALTIAPLLIWFLIVAVKFLFFVLLPTLVACWLLRGFESLTPRLVVYGVFASVAVGAHFLAQKQAEARALQLEQELAAQAAAEEAERREKAEDAAAMERARENAARKEEDEHKDAVARLVELTLEARARWRADVQAARAFGLEGEQPPMLRITDAGSYRKRVVNLGRRKSCVSLVRMLRQNRDEYLWCPQDYSSGCKDIVPNQSEMFTIWGNASNAACERGQFEYRVGHPLAPEPSWWSASALVHFDRNPPDPRDLRADYAGMTTLDLRSEILRIEKMLAETDRAQRWAQELAN